MADKRITELTNEKLVLGDGDYTIVDSNEGTYKYKLKRIADSIPAIDDSLSQEGEAADAKAVGDEIAGVKREIDYTDHNRCDIYNRESFNVSSGATHLNRFTFIYGKTYKVKNNCANTINFKTETAEKTYIDEKSIASGTVLLFEPTSDAQFFYVYSSAEGTIDISQDETYIDEIDNDVKINRRDFNAFSNGITIAHNETVTAGNNSFNFDVPIPSGTAFLVKNNSSTTTFTVKLIKQDGTVTTSYGNLSPLQSMTLNVNFDVYGLSSYVNNTDWKAEIKYGFNIKGYIESNSYKNSVIGIATTDVSETLYPDGLNQYTFYPFAPVLGRKYTAKNNGSGNLNFRIVKADGTNITVTLGGGNSYEFYGDSSYVQIGCYFTESTTVTFTSDGIYSFENKSENKLDTISAIEKYGFVQKAIMPYQFSSFTVIKGILYAFGFAQVNESTTGRKYKVNHDGTITTIQLGSFTSNIGHQNTVDYCENNNCLVSTRYDEPSESYGYKKVYVFTEADSLSAFDTEGENCIEYDLSQIEEIGNTAINAVWGDSNGGQYNILYVTSRDSVNHKRYIHLMLLGVGENNLEYGTFVSGVTGFNGTFSVLKTFEIEWGGEYSVVEGTNDMCLYNGEIYRATASSDCGASFVKHKFINFGNALNTERENIPIYNADGTQYDKEPEGITTYNNYLYTGFVDKTIYVHRAK